MKSDALSFVIMMLAMLGLAAAMVCLFVFDNSVRHGLGPHARQELAYDLTAIEE